MSTDIVRGCECECLFCDGQEDAVKHCMVVDNKCWLSAMGGDRLKDNGTRETNEKGLVRESKKGMGRFDLLPPEALFRVARICELGAEKYPERNWEQGGKWSVNVSSCLRHMFKWMRGDVDEDHLAMAVWNLMALMYYEDRYKEGCDIPNRNYDRNGEKGEDECE